MEQKIDLKVQTPTVLIFYFLIATIYGQEQKTYQYRSIMFYNVENLFDTIDDPNTLDNSFHPSGKYRWNTDRYSTKLDHIARVIGRFGLDGSGNGADIIGLCEVENRQVLSDLLDSPNLREHDYNLIHKDSPDRRGIDVGFIYKESCFTPINFQSHPLKIYNEQEFREYTRDQLVIQGLLDGEEMFFIINHWPSRRGGQAKSQPHRKAAARLTRRIVDSIKRETPSPKIIIMGDFNDNPINSSIKITLRSSSDPGSADQKLLFNPMGLLYRHGLGSIAYRDQWELFDQIMITSNLIPNPGNQYFYWKAGIYMPEYLLTQSGRFKMYPFRTYAAGKYQGGYSDHFPVYLILLREIK